MTSLDVVDAVATAIDAAAPGLLDVRPDHTVTDGRLTVGAATLDDGTVVLGLPPAAADALFSLLDALPLSHDLIDDGYPPDAVAIVSLLGSVLAAASGGGVVAVDPALYVRPTD